MIPLSEKTRVGIGYGKYGLYLSLARRRKSDDDEDWRYISLSPTAARRIDVTKINTLLQEDREDEVLVALAGARYVSVSTFYNKKYVGFTKLDDNGEVIPFATMQLSTDEWGVFLQHLPELRRTLSDSGKVVGTITLAAMLHHWRPSWDVTSLALAMGLVTQEQTLPQPHAAETVAHDVVIRGEKRAPTPYYQQLFERLFTLEAELGCKDAEMDHETHGVGAEPSGTSPIPTWMPQRPRAW